MKKILCTFVALPLLQAATAYADFTLDDLNGQYDHSFSATAVSNQGDSTLTEVGIFSADGQGHLTGEGNTTRSNVQGDLINSDVTYDCIYLVEPDGTGTMDCILDRGGSLSDASFEFVIDKEINSLGADPASLESVRQEIRFHSLSELPFKITNASIGSIEASYNTIGSAHRQSEYVEPPSQPQSSRYTNVDEDGKYLIDVLFVISTDAKTRMEFDNIDPDAWALEHINRTNADLERSQITTSKLRYVGKHYVDESDYKRTGFYPDSSNGTHALFWLSKYREAYGADKLAVIHVPPLANNGGGDSTSFPYRRYLPFSHEFGHAMDIHHGGCDGGDYTTKGYHNGAQFRWLNFDENGEEALPYPPDAGTIMCGNNSGFYTNANLTLSWEQIEQYVADGHLPNDLSFYEPFRETGMKMGHPVYADAARKWMEVDEQASKNMATSLPHHYTEDEWYEDDNCVAFYKQKNYRGIPTARLCIGEASANDPNVLQAQSIKVGRNAAVRYFVQDNYLQEISTLIYSSYSLQDYAEPREIDLADARSVKVFPRNDKDQFLASSYAEIQTLGENNDWLYPSGITATEDGKTIYVLHNNGIDVFDTTTGSLVKKIDNDNIGSHFWGLGITHDGKLLMPSENSPCLLINPDEGSYERFPNCSGNDADTDSEGNLYVVKRTGNVSKYTLLEDGSYSAPVKVIHNDGAPGIDRDWISIAIDKNRNLAYLVNYGRCRVLVYDLSTGEHIRSLGENPGGFCSLTPGLNGELKSPYGVAVDKNGWVYVSESRIVWVLYYPRAGVFDTGVKVYDENGHFIEQFGNTMKDPSHIVAPNDGKIYVVDSANVASTPGPSRVRTFQLTPQHP